MRAPIVLAVLVAGVAGLQGVRPGVLPEARAADLDALLGPRRSLLSFLPDDVRGGRFALRAEGEPEAAAARHWRGVFWRTASGNAYLRLDPFDGDVGEREVGRLTGRLQALRAEYDAEDDDDDDGAGDDAAFEPEAFFPLSRGDVYGGAEFQLPLSDHLYPSLRPREIDLLSLYGPDSAGCRRAVDAHRAAVDAAIAALRPVFRPGPGGRERWHVRHEPLLDATAGTRDAADAACTDDSEHPHPERLDVVVERWARGVAVRYVDASGREFGGVAAEVTPGDPGPPPAAPRPAPHDPLVNPFLVAVNGCGTLPWEYSNFMAGDSYTPPTDKSYRGPNPFSTAWVCEADVPADARERP